MEVYQVLSSVVISKGLKMEEPIKTDFLILLKADHWTSCLAWKPHSLILLAKARFILTLLLNGFGHPRYLKLVFYKTMETISYN